MQSRWIKLPILVVLVACGACGHERSIDLTSQSRDTLLVDTRQPVDSLKGTVLISAAAIGVARDLALVGNTLWVADQTRDPYLHAIDLSSGTLIGSFGRVGEGPGDFQGIGDLTTRPGDSTGIWVYDYQLRRLTRLSTVRSDAPPQIIRWTGDGSVYKTYWVSADRLLAIGDLDTNRFTLADTLGRVLRLIRAPILGGDSVSMGSRRALSTGFQVCVAPGGERFAEEFVGAGRIDIMNAAGARIGQMHVPFPSNGEFDRDAAGKWHARYTWRFYVDCAATSNHLYSLFAGNRTDRPPGGAIVSAHTLHVFNWKGDLECVLWLDHGSDAIAVAGDTVLYAAGMEDNRIWLYRLPGRLQTARDRSPIDSGSCR